MLPEEIVTAVQEGDLHAVQEWFSDGTRDVDERGAGNSTLLFYAIDSAHCDLVRDLLERGASVNITEDDASATPLHIAAMSWRYDIALLLLDRGAQINARDRDGHTPLLAAAVNADCNMIRLLLHRDADLDACNFHGRDAEFMARHLGRCHMPAATLLADVRAAGGWKPYVRAPRVRLLALRHFCAEGKAAPPAGDVLERLFPCPAAKVDGRRRTRAAKRGVSLSRTSLPKEIFWHVLEYWRCSRDFPY